jgi:hypothetical protein
MNSTIGNGIPRQDRSVISPVLMLSRSHSIIVILIYCSYARVLVSFISTRNAVPFCMLLGEFGNDLAECGTECHNGFRCLF